MSPPLVSVVMTVYNGARFLPAAVRSILAQTFTDFELIAIDDGSSDESGAILKSFANEDARIRLIKNESNQGIARSLNQGIDKARGEFIARMDADDEALPNRFARQLERLRREPSLILLGANVIRIDESGKVTGKSDLPLEDGDIRLTSLMQNPFAHPTVMIRAAPLRENGLRYDASFDTTEDYDFWIRLLEHGHSANISDPLVRLRRHPDSMVARKRERLVENSLRIQERYVSAFLGQEHWNRERFFLFIRGLLGNRQRADEEGVDRVKASLEALDLLRLLQDKNALDSSRFEASVLWRALIMGLAPPLRPGWTRLAKKLVLGHSRHLPHLSLRLIKTLIRKKARIGLEGLNSEGNSPGN